MKFKKGDRIACICTKNIHGVSFTCIIGTLVQVKKHWTGMIYVLEGQKSVLLTSKQDLKGQRMELSASVWKMMPWTEENKELVRKLREAALLFKKVQSQFDRPAKETE